MRKCAQKQKQTQRSYFTTLERPGKATSKLSDDIHSILHLQRTIGNQAVLRMLKVKDENFDVEQPTTKSSRFGHDFSRVTIYPTLRETVKTKLPINKPGDKCEREADRVARQEMDRIATADIINPPASSTAQGMTQRQEDGGIGMAQPVKTVQCQDETDSVKKGDENSSGYTGVGPSYVEGYQAPVRPRSAEVPTFLHETEGVAFGGQVEWGKPPQFPTMLGYTYYHSRLIELWPSFNLKCERSIIPWGYKCTPVKTDAAGAIWPSCATPENENGYRVKSDQPNIPIFQHYVSKYPDYEYYVRVSYKAAITIAECEQQHLNDYDHGWELTGEAVAKAINEVAAEEPTVQSDPIAAKGSAIDKVVNRLGRLGNAIRSYLESGGRLENALKPAMDNASEQSIAQRDTTGKHRQELRYVMVDDQKKLVLFEVNEDFKLDATPSSEVVNLDKIL